jgi:myosin protein heavy chain
MFGGRRVSPAAPGPVRTEITAPQSGAGDSHARAPHFRPAPSPVVVDSETLDEARRVLDDLRVHLAELDRREQSLNGQLTLLDREQRSLRQQTQQLADDSREIQQALDAREQRLIEREVSAVQLVRAADQRQAALDEQLADIERRRAELQDFIAAELVDERRQLAERMDDVDARQAELDRQRARLEAEVRAGFAQQEQQLDDQRSKLDALQTEIDRQRAAFRAEVTAEIAEEREQLAAEQAEFVRQRAEYADEVSRRDAARDQEIAEHAALLAQMRAEQLVDVEARDVQVGQREVDLVKRTRFQEEHLVRLRAGIEARQADLERARAALGVWKANVEVAVRQRLSHLRKYRDLLDRRESDCEAAWQALAEARRQQEATLETLRQNIIVDQQALEAQQHAAAGDLRRHADLLRLREQEVERRGARIDQLRDDLERRRQLIAAREADLQAAITWLSDQVGADEIATLLPQLEPAAAIPDLPVDDQRREIADAERQLSQWQHELQREREVFAQMIADREQRLRNRESAVGRQFELLATREAALQSERLRDRAEREQTFAILESLVEQIEQRLHTAT